MTDKNTKIIRLFEKNVSKVIIPKKFVILNKVVNPKKILNNIQKDYLIIQAYNNKDNNFILLNCK